MHQYWNVHLSTGSACTNGQVRLYNGTTASEGRVEYCYERKWTPLCSMNGNTASLVCKQLGFNSTCKYCIPRYCYCGFYPLSHVLYIHSTCTCKLDLGHVKFLRI